MIKTIIFDNHGVLVTSNTETVYPAMTALLGKKKATLFKKNYQEHKKEADRGTMTSLELFRVIASKIDVPATATKLRKTAYHSFVERKGMAELVRRLKKSYKIAILTDITDYFWRMSGGWGFMNDIPKKNIFVSAELKMTKPDPKIYLYALEKLNSIPEETIFIDDNPVNVEAAQKLGINGILFKNKEQLERDLKKYV